MATKDELALRLDATMWLLGVGMGELPYPLYEKLIDYREELKEEIGAGWAPTISGKLKAFMEASRGSEERKDAPAPNRGSREEKDQNNG